MALLWVDKHRPNSLDTVDYHRDLSGRLQKLAATGNVPHMLFVGPSGAGKSTRIQAFLREIYGAGVDALKVETRSVAPNPNNPSNTVDIQVVVSNHHLSLTPSDIGNKDRAVVMQLIKEVASHPPLGKHTFKCVVIEEAGCLTHDAQAALRRTMERYMRTCRIILSCESASKIIPPLRSRCLAIRVAAPAANEIQRVLQKVALKEGQKIPADLAQRIAEHTGRDLRRALLLLETLFCQHSTVNAMTPLPMEAWDGAVQNIANKILQEQSPKMAMEVRGGLYELLAAVLPADFILKQLLGKLLKAQHDDALKRKAITAAAHFESTLKAGSKDIFHLEAFVLRFMADYKASKGR